MIKKLNHHPFGLTLIELTVTVSLVVIMLSVSSLAYRQANKRLEIVLAAHNAASTLRLAESYAASAKELNNDPAQNAWGVYLDKADPDKLIMFNDKNNDGLYAGETEKFKTIAFGRQIKLHLLLTEDRDPLPENKVTVIFLPPDPKVRICPLSVACSSVNYLPKVVIVLKDDINQSTKELSVNAFGLVDVR